MLAKLVIIMIQKIIAILKGLLMKKNISQISPRYIVDESGKKKEVILDIKILKKFLIDLFFQVLQIEV